MAISLGSGLLAFGRGIMQGAEKEQTARQEKLDKRIQRIQEMELEVAKSRHKETYDEWSKNRKAIRAVQSAGSNQEALVSYFKDAKGYSEETAIKMAKANPDYQIPSSFFNIGDEPIFDYEAMADYSKVSVPNKLVSGISGTFFNTKDIPVDEQMKQIRAEAAAKRQTQADVMVDMPTVGPEQQLKFPGVDEKAPEIKKVFDESGRERYVQWDGSEWIPIGGVQAPTEKTGGRTLVYFDSQGRETRAVYTGNPEDSAGGISGYKQMGGAKAPTAGEGGAPVVKKIYDPETGGEVNAIFTGNAQDNFAGQQGWARFGGIKQDEGSVSRERWEVMKPIIMAPATGKKVTIGQFASADIYINANREALSAEYADALKTFENIGINTIDFAGSGLNIVVGGESVPATDANFARLAEQSGRSVKDLKIDLYRRYTGKDAE